MFRSLENALKQGRNKGEKGILIDFFWDQELISPRAGWGGDDGGASGRNIYR